MAATCMSDCPASNLPLGPRLGSGRSAKVFVYGPGHVLKLYKLPYDPTAPDSGPKSSFFHRPGLQVRSRLRPPATALSQQLVDGRPRIELRVSGVADGSVGAEHTLPVRPLELSR